MVLMRFRPTAAVCVLASLAPAQYAPPAGERAAIRRPGAESVLPGGRLITPPGQQFLTGPRPSAMALNGPGDTLVTADEGAGFPVTVLHREAATWRRSVIRDDSDPQTGAYRALVFATEREFYASEGATGRIRLLDARSGDRRQFLELNLSGAENSYAGDLAYDAKRRLLHALDEANARLVTWDSARRRWTASLKLPASPFALTLSPDARRAYVTLPAAIAAIDLENHAAPRLLKQIAWGKPRRLAAAGDRVYACDADADAIAVISARSLEVEREIPLRAPGLESLRGIAPIALHYEPTNQWLLAVEAGINALGVIDLRRLAVAGHIPAAWSPVRFAAHDGRAFTVNWKGLGTGPTAARHGPITNLGREELERGSVSIFPLPAPEDLPALTKKVWENAGLLPAKSETAPLPEGLDHAVIIVKKKRTFDEVLGDVENASNGPVAALPPLARFGRRGVIVQTRDELRQRLGLRFVNVTPNHHALADQFAFSDNFYAEGPVTADADEWHGAPEALWEHLDKHGVPFRNFGEGFAQRDRGEASRIPAWREPSLKPDALFRNTSRAYPGFNMRIPDVNRASLFINEIEREYLAPGKPLPRALFLQLPADHLARARPEDGYPFEASHMADNDYALGRIVEFLSKTPHRKRMAGIGLEDDATGGVDHVDSHRTLLFVAGPWARQNFCAHQNAGQAAVLKLLLRILRVPPLNLNDATAADLTPVLAPQPAGAGFTVQAPTLDIFDPARAREGR